MKQQLRIVWLVIFLATPNFAFAYIDPNAGGMFFQLLAPLFAAIIGGWMVMRKFITTIISGFFKAIIKRFRQ